MQYEDSEPKMKLLVFKTAALVSMMLLIKPAAHSACTEVVVSAFDMGWYNASGFHSPFNQNYLAGTGSGGGPFRNWFAFYIPELTQPVVSASLRILTAQISTPHGSETFQLRHVSTPIETLIAGSNGVNTYVDLGNGPIYGSRDILSDEGYGVVTISLNPACISDINVAEDDWFAIGGEITTLDADPESEEYLFGLSSGGIGSIELILNLAGTNALFFTQQPQSQVVNAGEPVVTFSAAACGSSTLGYQWQHDGTNLLGATSPELRLFDVTSESAGEYRLVVTNLSGSLTSSPATLTVIYEPPTATAYVAFATSPPYVGTDVTLCANVSGIPFPSVLWRFNGVALPGENGTCLYLPNVQAHQAGNYTIVASNSAGIVTSAVVSLPVTQAPPVYAYFPYDRLPLAVGSYAFMCAATDLSPSPSFRWRFNGIELPGETNQCLYVFNLDTNDAGFYTVVATNISGSYTSPPLELTVYYEPPGIPSLYFALGSRDALVGNDVTLCASAGGSPPLSYQWLFNGTNLPGANASCLSMLSINTNQAGTYNLMVSNVAGVRFGDPITLSVQYREPIFAEEPFAQMVVEGATVRIRGYAPAGPPATHILQLNGTNVPVPLTFDTFNQGGFTLLDVAVADAGDYQIIASNTLGVVTSQVATLTVTPAGPLDLWTQRNPLPQSQILFSLTHGNDLFVGVGDRGTVITSRDGTNWSVQPRRVDLALQGVAYGGILFVAVGDGGTILSSGDGTNWTYRYTAPFPLGGVSYGNGRFVTVGELRGQTFVLWSTNGSDWERLVVPSAEAGRDIAFGNGMFVAAGSDEIIVSTDGVNWLVTLDSLPNEIEGVAFVPSQFIAVGDNGTMFASSDGTSWTARNSGTTRRLLDAAYGNGQFVTAGVRGMTLVSTNGTTWSAAVSGTPDRLETILFANGLFIAAGENGTIVTSTNGLEWGKQNQGPTRDLDGMVVVNGLIVVVGKAGTILTSTNGTHYTSQDASVTNDLHGIAWGDGLFVAVGEPGIIVTSSNAIDWTSHPTGNTNSLKGATFGNGKWIVVGTDGAVITSTDGVNWFSAVTSPPYDLNDVAFGNDRFVIAADGQFNINGSAFVSSDGASWTWVNYPFGKNLRSILFTNELFFVTANDNRLFTSTNGFNWLQYFAPIFGNLRGATFAQGFWTVVGNRGSIATSANLLNWAVRPTRTFENLHDVVYLDGKLVTIGNRGTVLQTGRFVTELEPPRRQPLVGAAAAMSVVVKGIPGAVYELGSTANFAQWNLLSRFTNTTERAAFTDSNLTARPHQFYRVRQVD